MTAIILICIAGAVVSGISLKNHYSTSPTGYCDLDEIFNCDLVNRSVYSRIFDVPVALVGLIGYLFMAIASLVQRAWAAKLRLLAASLGLAFALYLAYIEARVLAVWCLLCIGSLLCIAGITALSASAVRTPMTNDPAPAKT